MNQGLPPITPWVTDGYPYDTLNKGKPNPNILIALAYYEGDRAQCQKLCQLIADLQPQHAGDECTFMLVARQDCEIDAGMVASLSSKFNILTYKANSPLRGWPGGCNGMFGTTMIHIANSSIVTNCVFWMEADCVPMRPEWHRELLQAWHSRRTGANVVGCMFDCNGNGSGMHITGCALYHPQFARLIPEACSCDNVAWDYKFRREMVLMGQNTDKIGLRFRGMNADEGILALPPAVWHGYKDFSLLDLVREKHLKPVTS